ncbi:MAG TPA: SprB repeat-containing protein, partial [Saprospiraceae bacterium]|nr:SprB repeat-containing protein [Saprospiraceae bacterium]
MCVLNASVAVVANFSVPDFGFILDTVSCLHPQAHLSFVPYGGVTYTNVYWNLPDLTLVPGPNLFSNQPGDNHLYAVGANGCIGVKTISIPFDTISPFLLTESDTLICNDTVQILAHSLDPVLAFQWNGPGILNVNGDTATVNKAGLYTITATGINGCATPQLILVDSNYTKPDFTLIADSLRCDRQATLMASTTDSIIQYQWYNAAGQVIGIDSSIQVNAPGLYSVALKGLNRCVRIDTVVLKPPVFPNISIEADTLTCSIQTVTLQSIVDFTPAGYSWVDQNLDTIGHGATQDIMNRGPFQLVVTGQNGCITRDTIQVPYDTLRPVANINLIGEVRCQFKDVMFDGSASTPANIAYQWSTQGGNIIGSNTIPVIAALDTGYYSLVVTRLDNGCQDSTAYHLLPSPDAIAGTLISVIRPKCNGDNNGSVSIDAVQGGIGPFLYQLNGGAPQPQILFDG